jgi:hypothetical protein
MYESTTDRVGGIPRRWSASVVRVGGPRRWSASVVRVGGIPRRWSASVVRVGGIPRRWYSASVVFRVCAKSVRESHPLRYKVLDSTSARR